ncbi:MAG: hypothetical protein ACRDTU_20360 [Micromonosporaceae bacterium]
MRVNTDEMIAYGKARNGDGMVCAAAKHLFEKVGTLPANHWGRLPSSADWRKGWDAGAEDRTADARSASDVLLDTSEGLLRAMANYTNTDIAASVSLEKLDPGIKPYLRSDIRDDMAYDAGRYGGDGGGGFDPRYRAGDDPDSPLPVDSPPGNSLAADAQYRDEYAKFMAKYASLFRSIEEAIKESVGEVPEVYEPYLKPAIEARPDVIERYADEVDVGCDAYDYVFGRLRYEGEYLGGWWDGDGGRTFRIWAKIVEGYVTECWKEARWLATQGHAASGIIKNVRSTFAKTIDTHLEKLKDAYSEYRYRYFWEGAKVVAGLAAWDATVLKGDNCAEALRAAYQEFRTDIRTALDDADQGQPCKLGSEDRDRPKKPELRVDDWKHPHEW